ncbi:MAG: hypothetical protein WKG00_37875 [Polyangiaceae bacterium]
MVVPHQPAPPAAPAWQVVFDGDALDGAVLSVWGTGPDEVFAVGGPLGNTGGETLALRFDGATWRRLSPGGTQTFWWVSGTGPGDVWMVGTGGRIAHWDGAAFTEHDSGVSTTLWGVWAASPTDAWAVGGTPEGGTTGDNDLVLHWDGAAWTRVTLPGAPRGRAHYKVWGASSDDLYVVGEAGTIWHKKGDSWAIEGDGLAEATLFTVNGCSGSEVYAVGGRQVLVSDGSTWSDVAIELFNDVNGVACNAPGEVAIVGFGGLKQRLVDGAWIDEFTLEPYEALHATWGDGEAFWAVGGDWLSKPKPGRREGVVARYGAGIVADTPP